MPVTPIFEPNNPNELLRGWLLHAHKGRDRHDLAARQCDQQRYLLGIPATIMGFHPGRPEKRQRTFVQQESPVCDTTKLISYLFSWYVDLSDGFCGMALTPTKVESFDIAEMEQSTKKTSVFVDSSVQQADNKGRTNSRYNFSGCPG